MSDLTDRPDLAAARLGGSVLYATDDFFAEKENLLRPEPAVWKEHAYTDRGKWMDGWESRRKREEGFDFAIVRLGLAGVIRGVVVDTAFFRGNFPEACALHGAIARSETSVAELLGETTKWHELVPRSILGGDTKNVFKVESHIAVTHVRLSIFPDGGVARLRVHGDVSPDWRALGGAAGAIDLAALESGGEVLSCSDMFFGPKNNLIQPGRAADMSDGWETKRRRGITPDTHDWVLIRLAGRGVVDRIEIDTAHFKGNFPDTASIEGCDGDPRVSKFVELLPRTKLLAHTRHTFVEELSVKAPLTHLRLKVFPDGGVSRLRAWGKLTDVGIADAVVRRLSEMTDETLNETLHACCGSARWALAVRKETPFASGSRFLMRAEEIWNELSDGDRLEAFAAHPRIGERAEGKSTHARWSRGEQKAASEASEADRAQVAELGAKYEAKFGHVFLICATGLSAADIAAACRTRLDHTKEQELAVAGEEQRKIMRLRLRKLVFA